MRFKNHFLYWIFPSAVILLLIGMYFSGNETAMWLVVPPANRELGALESLQHLTLLIMVIVAARAAIRAEFPRARGLYALMAAAAAFLCLEEINYGTQYWLLITGAEQSAIGSIDNLNYVNLHNQGDLSDLFKDVGDAMLVLLFVILPLSTLRVSNKWVQFFRPGMWFMLTLVCSFLASRFAHYLDDHHAPVSPFYDDAAIGEYRELFTYWIWFLYYWLLAVTRRWPEAESPG